MEYAEIAARADALAAASAGGAIEPWMRWVHAYHALLRGALAARRAAGRRRGREVDVDALVERARERSGFRVGRSFVERVLDPPGGRVVGVVLATVARTFRAPAAEVGRTVLPRRRRTGG